MKKIALTLFIALISVFSFGQKKKTIKPLVPKIHKWDTLFYKNEFSFDVKPVFLFAFATSPANDQWEFGYTYRRFFDKRNALRIGNRFQLKSSYYTNSNLTESYFNEAYSNPPFYKDSLIDMKSDQYMSKNDINIRTGYEHRFFKRRVKFILGLDVINGISFYNYSLQTTQAIVTRTGQDEYIVKPLTPTYTNMRSIDYKIGLSPIVGMNIHLSKRFSINASFTPEIYWLFPFKKGNKTYVNQGFNIDASGMITDISFTVHF